MPGKQILNTKQQSNVHHSKKKKKKVKEKHRKMKVVCGEEAKHRFIAHDGDGVGEKKKADKRKVKVQITAEIERTHEEQSHQSMKKKRKHLDDTGSSSKLKKRKTSLDHEVRKEHCQELNKTDQKKNPESKGKTQNTARKVKSVKDQGKIAFKKAKHSKGKRKKNAKETISDNVECESDLIHNLWHPSEELMQQFGLKKGKWSKKEEKILRENMDRFLQRHDIDDPMKLIFAYENRETEEGKKWKEFAESTSFYRDLSKGLNRSLYFVYRKVLRFFDTRNYVGKFSELEDKELLRLVALHGRNWSVIGGLMGRSGLSLVHRYKWVESKSNNGPWHESEIKCLQEAVRKLTNTRDGEEVYSGINWASVALIVKTRNPVQCRQKWLVDICWKDCKLSTTTKKTWGPVNDVELITKLYESPVTEESDIDWLALTTDFEMAHSPYWLRMKFATIKRKHCKSIHFEDTDFEDVIDYLNNVVAIDLQNQIFQQQQHSS